MSFFNELKRRNVLRVGAAYVVAAWLVIQVVETLFPVYGLSDAAIRMVVSLLAVGLLPVLIIAWAFELTPDGIRKEQDVDRSRSITPQTGRKLDRMIMVVLALALGFFAFDKFVLNPQREVETRQALAEQFEQAQESARAEPVTAALGEQSIAVLPFQDMSSGGDQEYLGDGLAEELLNLLAAIPELRVISRSSAFSYKNKDINLTEVARELGVAHILEGSVRTSGNTVRITAQLIDARSDTHLWSKTYDRTLDDLFAIQDDIAAVVVEQLQVTLLGDTPHARKVDPEAYALFLQGNALLDRDGPDDVERAVVLFERAVEKDPRFARAWVRLAAAHDRRMREQVLPVEEGVARQRALLQTALALDPNLASAHEKLGWVEMAWRGDLKAAAPHYARAVTLAPSNAGAAGLFLFTLGRVAESVPYFAYEARTNPVSATAHANLGSALILSWQVERGLAELEMAALLSPQRHQVHFYRGLGLLMVEKPELALVAFDQESDETSRVRGRAMALHDLGRQRRV